MLNIITVAGLKGGVGKSSISRVLAEKIEASILNFDPKRNAELYNSIETLNIKEDSKIERKRDYLIVDNSKISSKKGYLICDFGGQFDTRILNINSDIYLLPTADDFESISETIRTAKMILSSKKEAKIIFILNKYLIRNKKDEVQALEDFKEILKENDLEKYTILEMPYSKLFKNIVNFGLTKEQIISKNKLLKNSYKNINKFINQLEKEIKKELEK